MRGRWFFVKRSNWALGKTAFCVVIAVLLATVFGCSQPATPTPTTAPKATSTREAKPEATAAKPVATSAARPQAKEAPKEPKKLTKLTIPYDAVSGVFTPLWVTVEKKLFEKYGLDVEVPYIASSTTVTQALLSKELVLTMIGGRPATNANLAGADLVYIAGTNNFLGFSMYVQSDIKRIEDLKGKTVGVTRFGSSTDFGARYTLKKFGLEPDKDVAMLQTGGTPETLAALKSGGIHGGVFGPPTTIQARKLGLHELVNMADLGVPYLQTAIIVSKGYWAANQETVSNFMKALLEGIAITRQDKAYAMQVLGKYTKIDDNEVLDDTYDLYVTKLLPKVPYVNAEAVQTILDEAALSTPKAKEIKPETYIDNRLIKEFDESGFIKKLYGE